MERKKNFESIINYWKNLEKKTIQNKINRKSVRSIKRKKPISEVKKVSEIVVNPILSSTKKSSKITYKKNSKKLQNKFRSRTTLATKSMKPKRKSSSDIKTESDIPKNLYKIFKELRDTEITFLKKLKQLKKIADTIFDDTRKYYILNDFIAFSKQLIEYLDDKNISYSSRLLKSLKKCEKEFDHLNKKIEKLKDLGILLEENPGSLLINQYFKWSNTNLSYNFDSICDEEQAIKEFKIKMGLDKEDIEQDGFLSLSIVFAQRIARYPLLINEINRVLKKYSTFEKIKNQNEKLLESVLALANFINGSKEKKIDSKIHKYTKQEEKEVEKIQNRFKYCVKMKSDNHCDSINKFCKEKNIDTCPPEFCKPKRKGFQRKSKCRVKKECYNS